MCFYLFWCVLWLFWVILLEAFSVWLLIYCNWTFSVDELLLEKRKMAFILYVIIALPCTVGAIALAIFHIYRHLVNYTEPTFQRYIVRIIFMVPVSTMFFWHISTYIVVLKLSSNDIWFCNCLLQFWLLLNAIYCFLRKLLMYLYF